MLKYGFLVHHSDYDRFLSEVQELGVLHIIGHEAAEPEGSREKTAELVRIRKAIDFLERRPAVIEPESAQESVVQLLTVLEQNQVNLENLKTELSEVHKELQKALPWGDFSPELIRKLEGEDVHVRFFAVGKQKFTKRFQRRYRAELISESHHKVYFVCIQRGNEVFDIEADELVPPDQPVPELEARIAVLERQIKETDNGFDRLAHSAIPLLKAELEQILSALEYEQVSLQTRKEFNRQMMILEAWVPQSNREPLDRYLVEKNIVFTVSKASPRDKAPVLLQNDRFSRLFEPIGKIFSLPGYAELDLTVFFAPFFMLFFGFCLGDAGYGVIFIVAAGLYKFRAPKNLKPYLTLAQFLGAAAVLFGIISGTLFGVSLIETDLQLTEKVRSLFLAPEAMFNLALILGAIQIVFGMCVKAANLIKQFGFRYGIGTLGWLLIIVGCLIYAALVDQKIIDANLLIIYGILIIGGSMVLFFSDPEAGVFMRMGKGVWDIYSTVTGIFGDLLSYIRLFAIGLSSSILGYVINDIGLTILHASSIFGPVLFALFLLLGHTLNLLISTLGSFVHPMRLTFVEFYKNAGFTGGGKEYKPFLKYK